MNSGTKYANDLVTIAPTSALTKTKPVLEGGNCVAMSQHKMIAGMHDDYHGNARLARWDTAMTITINLSEWGRPP